MRKKVDKEGVEKKDMRKSTGKKDIADKHKEPMITFPQKIYHEDQHNNNINFQCVLR